MSIKFTYVDDHKVGYIEPTGETLEMKIDHVYLPDVLEAFTRFLRGIGFVCEGELDFVPQDYGNDYNQHIE
jgi:hypothetical protein